MTRTLPTVLAASLLVLAPSAAAVGPSLGTVNGSGGVSSPSGEVRYVTTLAGSQTRLARIGGDGTLVKSVRLAGAWGVPLVTINGETGGLSRNGRVLVLSDNTAPGGRLRPRSGFAVADAGSLELRRTIHLHGDFSFDALSPEGTLLYLIQHASSTDLTSYRVRAYDLGAGRLLPGVIADKRQAGWRMNGMPVARATSPNGRWVYTLYDQGGNYPFVHALDTLHQTAVCIGLPWDWSHSDEAIMSASLTLAGGTLRVDAGAGSSTRFAIDTRTFHVSAHGDDTTA